MSVGDIRALAAGPTSRVCDVYRARHQVAFRVRRVGLDSREARLVLAAALDPCTAAALIKTWLRSLLRQSGRQRHIDVWADRLRTIFTGEYLHQPPLVEQAMGRQTQALMLQLDAACPAAGPLTGA